jgi:murein DD-endopeptidase MepM/ murein hydrolase activator NlpD
MNPLLPLVLLAPALATGLATALLLPPDRAAMSPLPLPVVVAAAGSRPGGSGSGTVARAASPPSLRHASPAAGPPSVATSSAVTAPRGPWTWPLSPRPAVRRPFDAPAQRWLPGHRGVDLAGSVGQPVLSAGAGTVTYSGVVAGRGVVSVRHADGLRTTYEPVDDRAARGTAVARGARIGTLARTPGHCVPAACLHWGAVEGDTYRDPLTLVDPGRPVLLPLR